MLFVGRVMSVLSPTPPPIAPQLVPSEWLSRFESELRRLAFEGQELPSPLKEAIEHSLLAPCKRLRPMLVMLAAEACGADMEPALVPACAVEMVHTYSLIHDDLPAMDDDDMRRGRPTCHVAFGEANAILAGDALLTRAFEIIATHLQPPAIAATCLARLASSAGGAGMVGGQVDDLMLEGTRGDQARLESIHLRKTASLISASVSLGAIVARGSEEQVQRLSDFGIQLGLAFQITDDLLDVVSSVEDLGKRTRKDATRGKLTYPGLMGVEASRRRAAELVSHANRLLEDFGDQGERLRELARFVLSRVN